MPKENIRIAIAIACYNNLAYTKITLSSILKHTHIPYTVLLVNNASQDGSKEFFDEVARQNSNFIVFHSTTNLGFAGGTNIALREIQQDKSYTHILLLNNDVIVPPYYIEQLMETFSVDKSVGVSVPVTNYAGNQQAIKNVEVNPATFDDFARKWSSVKGNCRTFQIGMAIGFAMLIKRECFDKVGLLDERFENAWDDNDYCLRIAQVGYTIRVTQNCFIYHFGSKTIKSMKDVNYGKQIFETNKKKFYDKWAEINHLGEKKKIVGILRVRNGGWMLKEAISAVSRMVDEIVVFDDHSTDDTEETCRAIPNMVGYYKSEFTDFNEARDRNFLLQMAKKRNPDWIYSWDADESPEDKLVRDIQKIIANPNPEIKLYCFQICNIWNTVNDKSFTKQRYDGIWNDFRQGRLFKNEPNQEIKGIGDDGLHCGSHPFFSQENVSLVPYRIKHYGNADAQQRFKKYMSYTATDKDKDKNAIMGNHYEFYRKLYGMIEAERPENKGRILGDYQMKDGDYYRHIVNENSLQLSEWKENITVSASIIVKQDDYEYLPKCLESIKDIVDEIVIVKTDGGEDDGYPCFSKEIENKVERYYYKWDDSFSNARNFALSKCQSDWIIRIDADEVLQSHGKYCLMKLINNDEAEVILFPIINYMEQPSSDGKQKWTMSKTARAYKNIKGLKYVGRVHEEINDSIVSCAKEREMRIYENFPVPLYHYGYLKDKNKLYAKYDYYNRLLHMDIQENPKRFEPYFNLAVDYFHQDDLDKAEMYYRKTLELNPKQERATHDLAVTLYQKGLNRN